MEAPVAPKRKPVIRLLNPSPGIRRAIGVPAPNMKMTRESPIRTSNAVPIISERKSAQGMGCLLGFSIIFQKTGSRL